MKENGDKKEKKISVALRAKAFIYVMPWYTLPMLINTLKSTPAHVENELINEYWRGKKTYSRKENIYKDWCNGMDYPTLQRKYYAGQYRYKIMNALNDVRQEIINDIFEKFAGEPFDAMPEDLRIGIINNIFEKYIAELSAAMPETKTTTTTIKRHKKSENELLSDYLKLCKEIQENQ